VASFASADTPATPTPIPTSTPSVPIPSDPTEQPDVPSNPDQAEQEAALIQVLSEMFGVDEMRVAYEAAGGPAALDGYLDEAVRSGILTQEEADTIRQAVEQGMSRPGPR
jgi:hypothetical protein